LSGFMVHRVAHVGPVYGDGGDGVIPFGDNFDWCAHSFTLSNAERLVEVP
jgi:hypothetical protein